jgi:uncharacterized protein YfkK (UPF0435 family)
MTMLEEVIQKLKTVDEGVLERVKDVLDEAEELATKYPGLPDVRVKRSPEEIAEFRRVIRELAEPVPGEDLTEFKKAIKRQPWRSQPGENNT